LVAPLISIHVDDPYRKSSDEGFQYEVEMSINTALFWLF